MTMNKHHSMVISKEIHIVKKIGNFSPLKKCHFLSLSVSQLSVMQEDCAFTRQGSHVPRMGGPKNKFPAPLFLLFGNFPLRITWFSNNFAAFLKGPPMVPFYILCDIVYWKIEEEYYNLAYSVVLSLLIDENCILSRILCRVKYTWR